MRIFSSSISLSSGKRWNNSYPKVSGTRLSLDYSFVSFAQIYGMGSPLNEFFHQRRIIQVEQADQWILCSISTLGSALALMRLQDTYRLPPSELANGQISAKFQSKRLTGGSFILHSMKINAMVCSSLGVLWSWPYCLYSCWFLSYDDVDAGSPCPSWYRKKQSING